MSIQSHNSLLLIKVLTLLDVILTSTRADGQVESWACTATSQMREMAAMPVKRNFGRALQGFDPTRHCRMMAALAQITGDPFETPCSNCEKRLAPFGGVPCIRSPRTSSRAYKACCAGCLNDTHSKKCSHLPDYQREVGPRKRATKPEHSGELVSLGPQPASVSSDASMEDSGYHGISPPAAPVAPKKEREPRAKKGMCCILLLLFCSVLFCSVLFNFTNFPSSWGFEASTKGLRQGHKDWQGGEGC